MQIDKELFSQMAKLTFESYTYISFTSILEKNVLLKTYYLLTKVCGAFHVK